MSVIDAICRSLENPKISLQDSEAWEDFGFSPSISGVMVTHKKALAVSAFWRGINLLSRDIAKVPLVLYRRLEGGGKDRAREHPAYSLMRRKFSPDLTAFNAKQTLQSHALTHGNGYGYIFRGGTGSPKEVVPLSPFLTHPVRADGKLWYVTEIPGTNEKRRIRSEDMLHVRGLGFDGLLGYDVVSVARETLGLSLAMQQYGSVFFANNAMPGVVLEHPEKLSPEAKESLAKHWGRMHKGLENAHRTAVLEEGMKATVLSANAKNSQLQELQEFEIRQIANFIGVPPHKVGDTTRTAFASLEQENQSYLQEALDGWFCQWEDECTDKLLTEREKREDTHFFEFKREAIIQVDFATKVEALVSEVNNGLKSPNEARAIMNDPPTADGLGDKFRMPENIGFVEAKKTEPEPEPEPAADKDDDDTDDDTTDDEQNGRSDDERDAIRAIVADCVSRTVTRIGSQAKRAAKKPDTYIEWAEKDFDAGCLEALADALVPAACLWCGCGKDEGRRVADVLVERLDAPLRESLLSAADVSPNDLADNMNRSINAADDLCTAEVLKALDEYGENDNAGT